MNRWIHLSSPAETSSPLLLTGNNAQRLYSLYYCQCVTCQLDVCQWVCSRNVCVCVCVCSSMLRGGCLRVTVVDDMSCSLLNSEFNIQSRQNGRGCIQRLCTTSITYSTNRQTQTLSKSYYRMQTLNLIWCDLFWIKIKAAQQPTLF